MKFGQALSLLLQDAFTNFRRNKIRTVLTSLGIMIGVLSVVMLIALGLGLKNYIHEQFENLGTNLVAVMPGNTFSEEGGLQGFGAGMMGGPSFDEKDVNNLKNITYLEYVVPIFYKLTPVQYKTDKELGYVFGTNEDVFAVLNLEPEAGTQFSKSDVKKKSKEAVMGYTIAEKLFTDPDRAIGKTINVSGQRLKIVGVSQKKGDLEMDSSVIVPYTTSFKKINPDKSFLMFYLGVTNEDDVNAAITEVEATLLDRYNEDDFSVTESTEILSAVNQIFTMINGVLIAIGSISLLVGGIGIMNIMYASVTERTKEVGIRRSIGATQSDILLQFVTEAVVLSVFGGFMGLALSALIVLAIQPFFPAAINLTAVLIAFGVSTLIGIFFGVFPARRAAKLPPIEAIRYE